MADPEKVRRVTQAFIAAQRGARGAATGVAPQANHYLRPAKPQTEIWIGYTPVHLGRGKDSREIPGVNHAFVMAVNPKTGEKFVARAGPNWDGDAPDQSKFSIHAEAKKWEDPTDNGKAVHWQKVGSVDLPINSVYDRMKNYSDQVNRDGIFYGPISENSNAYAFSFLPTLGLSRPSPRQGVFVPGGSYDMPPRRDFFPLSQLTF